MSDWYDNIDMKDASRILNLPAPSDDKEPVRKIDLNNAVQGLKQKDPVRVRTSTNINLSSPGSSLDGITFASGDLNKDVLVAGQTSQSENGIYTWNGAAVAMTRRADANTAAELNNALVPVLEGTSEKTNWRQTATITTLGSDNVTWALFGTTAPPASESTPGLIEIATQTETNTGSDDTRAVTPAKLAGWSGRKYKNGSTYGDTSATQFDVTHNFNTLDVTIATYRVSTGERVYPKERALDVNTVRVNYTVAPGNNEFRTVVIA